MSVQPDQARNPISRHGAELAVGVVGLAIVLRIPGLTEWWLNPDEGIYFSILTQERFAAFWAEAKTTAHPPLYFLILRAMGWLSTDFLWLRGAAFVCGSAAVLAFIHLGREIAGGGARGWPTGLLAGLLLAVSPRAIVLSQVIRPYMLLILLLAGSLYFLLRYLRTLATPQLFAHAACSVVATLLHYSSALALGVLTAIAIAGGARRQIARREWRLLLAAEALPAVTLAAMYAWHLQALMGSTVADNALEGWLSAYMVRTPPDVWLGFVGVHSMLVGDALAVSATLLTVIAMGWAAWSRAWTPLLATSMGLGIAAGGAVAQLYPLGATRHSAWLLVFVVPALAWALADMLGSRRGLSLRLPVLVALVALAGPLSSVLDAERRPREISERVLRRAHVPAMAEVLEPQAEPELIFLSTETYQLLTPLYTIERQTYDASRDGLLHRFRWGDRQVIVLPGRDFLALPDQVGRPNHLRTAIRTAEGDFGVHVPRDGQPVLVLAGGWESRGMADMVDLARRAGSFGTTISVPGLIALSLDVRAYERVLADLGA